MITLVPCRAAWVQHVEIEGDVLLLDGETLHRLTGTGAAVWRLADGLSTVEDVVTTLAKQCATAVGAVRADVQGVCEELVRQGLLSLAEAPPGVRHVRPDHVGYVRDGDHLLLADLRTGVRRALSPLGARIWDLVGAGMSKDELLTALERDHPSDDVRSGGVEELLDHLCAAGVLRRTTGA